MRDHRSGARKKDFSGPKVESISLNEKHITLRLVLMILALLSGVAALTWSITGFLGEDAGWNEICATDAETDCTADYTFLYKTGHSGLNASKENKALSELYTGSTDYMCLLLDPRNETEGINNLCTINRNPNISLKVAPELYDALKQLAEASDFLLMGPVLEEYRSMFSAETSDEALRFDPYTDPESSRFVAEVVNFVHNGEVKLLLEGNDTVCLYVSEAYLDYASEMEIECFLDAGILADAIIIDETANRLISSGYTDGILSSESGVTRSLSLGQELNITEYSLQNNEISYSGTYTLNNIVSAVVMRSFPLTESEYWYADLGNGEIRTAYIDVSDGLCKTSTDFLVASSASLSCTETAVSLLPLYACDKLDVQAVEALKDMDISVIYS